MPAPDTRPPLTVTDGFLVCPLCGDNYVHLDEAYVAGRAREDGPVTPAMINSDGHASSDDSIQVPMANNDAGRRHTISLAGRCEGCSGRFAIAFKQHKGQTVVDVLRQDWTTLP
jgi:hypothetical protein